MSAKRKNQHTLPNRQLARAFNFSAQDLAANRAGVMSRAQEWRLPRWMRQAFGWLDDVLPLRRLSAGCRKQVQHLCGRIQLDYQQREIFAAFHVEIYERHFLWIQNHRFLLTPQQYRAMVDGMIFHVYFDEENQNIVSLERAINGCDEAA